MSDRFSQLRERIRFHYREEKKLEEFMDVRLADIQDLESIPYTAILDGFGIPTSEFEINYLAEEIAKGMLQREFSYFLSSLPNAECETIETNLEELADTLNKTYDDLYDNGNEATQLFASVPVKSEVKQRTESLGSGIRFSMGVIVPILANELGNSQIIISNKHCFGKIYPENLKENILVFPRRGNQNQELDCEIRHNFQFRSLDSMKKIIITDMSNSQ